MDPTVCLINALSCCRDGHAEDAAENFRNLAEWIERGGFLPNVTAPGVRLQTEMPFTADTIAPTQSAAEWQAGR